MELFDKVKEEVRETVSGVTPENDLRARLHVDHEAISDRIEELAGVPEQDVERRRELVERLVVDLTAHSRAEDEVVYAELTARDPLRDRAERARHEHEQIDRALLDLRALRPGDPAFAERLEALKELLDEHVHDEENVVLPKAELVVGQPELAELIPRFDDRLAAWRMRLEGEAHGEPTTETSGPVH